MANEGFKRKLTAILSADVAGYSRLMGYDEEATIRTLNDYRKEISNHVKHHRGRVVDTTGDNLLAEFASAVDAVKCSIEIQRDLAERNAQLSYDRRMEFRIGVNVGDVVEEEKQIYGDGVNIAARVESLADAGGICISGRVYDQVENKFDLKYEFLGEKEVKNIARPIRVYRLLSYPGAAAYRVLEAKKTVGKRWRNTFISVVCILLGGAAMVSVWHFYLIPPPTLTEIATEQTPKLDLPDLPSIAVLPFVNVGGAAEQEYFSDGMTDDLITDLSKISGLFVIARNSVFTYKGKPVIVQNVAKELGVRYVLEGSVRRAGDKLRINAQLIDATTGHHLWAERYDGQIGDVFALQDRITEKIVAALAVKLTSGEQEQVIRKYTDNISAYDAFLQGRAHYTRRTPDDLVKAVSYFEKAVELDPNYGQAFAALALSYLESHRKLWVGSLGVSNWEAYELARRYQRRAMQNPSPLAHQAASEVLLVVQRCEDAIVEAERAIALDPNDTNSYLAMAYALIFAGRPKEAFGLVEKAMRLDPHYPAYHLFVLGLAHFGTEQFEKAVTLFERALKRNPQNYVPLIPLAAALAHLGRKQEAKSVIENLKKVVPGFTLQFLRESFLFRYKDSEDQQRLSEGLRKAGVQETIYDALHGSE
jgi:TolB-like protein/class 3 adenylate cyclase/Flp pilus assembly protein TadD